MPPSSPDNIGADGLSSLYVALSLPYIPFYCRFALELCFQQGRQLWSALNWEHDPCVFSPMSEVQNTSDAALRFRGYTSI